MIDGITPASPGERLRHRAEHFLVRCLRFGMRFAPSEAQRIFLLTIGIGCLCGLAAVGFHLSIGFFERLLIDPAIRSGGTRWIFWTIATPTLGGITCGVLLQYVVPNARGSGIPQVKAAFASSPAIVPLRDALGKFFVGSLQIGSGASLGREGPTVQICAGIASWLGRAAGVSPKNQRRLLPVGVAAGIAAAFNAPIAAVTFTIEEVVGKLDQAVLSGVIVAAAVAAVIERSLLGGQFVFDVHGSYGLAHASSLLLYAGIGLAAALASIVFTESLLALRLRMRRWTRIPAWVRPGLGGLATGVLAVFALSFFAVGGVTGGGYETLGLALNGHLAWRVLLVLSVLKLLATVASYSSGGAGGIFAPTLFIGGTLGGALGALGSSWLGHAEPAGAFALVGMGAMFAGVIRAPITSVLIIVEMTGGYGLILPLMIANMTAYVLARRFRAQSIYEALLAQDGVQLGQAPDALDDPRRIAALFSSEPPVVLAPGTSGAELLARCGAPDRERVYPVVDPERRLVGVVTHDDLATLRSSPELARVTVASDLMRPPVRVQVDDDAGLAVERMLSNGMRELPVTDAAGHLLGIVDSRTIAQAYRAAGTAGP